jgi:hypothetical protein
MERKQREKGGRRRGERRTEGERMRKEGKENNADKNTT